MAKPTKPPLPRVPVPRPTLSFRTRRDELFRKRKHRKRDDAWQDVAAQGTDP